jgi:hypothetical protein
MNEPRVYLNAYRPLAINRVGLAASARFGIPPFVDGSIRREPDLEHLHPTISCLCRADKFAPRLIIGDVVAYLAVKHAYGEDKLPHRRLVAILGVESIFASHSDAAKWFEDRGEPLPNNCMVRANPSKPLTHSHRQHSFGPGMDDEELLRKWDLFYHARARSHGVFVVCNTIFRDLSWQAPIVEDQHLLDSFGKVPVMQNPGVLPMAGLNRLLNLLGLPDQLSCQ